MEIQFRLFGIPVHVSAFFLLIAFVLGRQRQADTPALMATWMVVMFVGILLHELGHALTAKAFGQAPAISLHGLGGVTVWEPKREIGPGKRALITVAGPLVGLAIGFPVLVIAAFLTKGSMVYRILEFVWEVNLAWAIFNLLPMLPLDGGRIMAALLELVFGKGALRAAYILSIVVAVLIGLLMVWLGSYITLAFCAFFIYLNVQAMRELDRPAPPPLDA